MTGLADVDRFKICIQVCVWLGFPPLKLKQKADRFVNIFHIYRKKLKCSQGKCNSESMVSVQAQTHLNMIRLRFSNKFG